MLPSTEFLATRVRKYNNGNWAKLTKAMNYFEATKKEIATMSTNNSQTTYWIVDSSFSTNKNMKNHTWAIMTLGNGPFISILSMQKVKAKAQPKSEMVAVNNTISKVLWS